jgi:hypothetical protein
MVKQDLMAADEWHNSGPQDLITVSLSIQIAIAKMQLCSLSVAYAIALPPPWGTLHNVDRSEPLDHTMPYTLAAIFPVQLKRGFFCEEHTSPAMCQGEHLPH